MPKNLKLIKARFDSRCAATGEFIPKGVNMFYDYANKKCYTQEAVADGGFKNDPAPEEEPEDKYYKGHTVWLERNSAYDDDGQNDY